MCRTKVNRGRRNVKLEKKLSVGNLACHDMSRQVASDVNHWKYWSTKSGEREEPELNRELLVNAARDRSIVKSCLSKDGSCCSRRSLSLSIYIYSIYISLSLSLIVVKLVPRTIVAAITQQTINKQSTTIKNHQQQTISNNQTW